MPRFIAPLMLLILITLSFLFAASLVNSQTTLTPPMAQAPVPGEGLPKICAGNIPPEDMAITSTVSTVECGGSCRGRAIEPLKGPVMVICAGQPIPEWFEIQSVTSTPACNCLGDEDNSYVIREKPGRPIKQPQALGGENPAASNRGRVSAGTNEVP